MGVSAALTICTTLDARAQADGVSVFAAASLRDVVEDIGAAFTRESGAEVTLVFAASSAIARQVDQGAPADVVVLADARWSGWLTDRGAIQGAQPVIGNRLVLIGTGGESLAEIADLPRALEGGVLAVAQVESVPAGRYAKAALEAFGLWDPLVPQVVQASNVRAALRFVERGEARFGIGYESDLVALPALTRAYAFPPSSHPQIVYTGAAVTPQGADFFEFLSSETARRLFQDWGFVPAERGDD